MFVGHVLLMILVATAAELLMVARRVLGCATRSKLSESLLRIYLFDSANYKLLFSKTKY